jgi:hypothetical protein
VWCSAGTIILAARAQRFHVDIQISEIKNVEKAQSFNCRICNIDPTGEPTAGLSWLPT